MRVFFDSSAFAKRYIEEAGSEQVEAYCAKTTTSGLSILCLPEILSAFNRRIREKSLNQNQYQIAKEALIHDIEDADIVRLEEDVLLASRNILEQTPVRAMDAIHVASAKVWNAERFITSDHRQHSAALDSGLSSFLIYNSSVPL